MVTLIARGAMALALVPLGVSWPATPAALAATTASGPLVVAGFTPSNQGTVTVVGTTDNVAAKPISVRALPVALALSADGKTAYVLGYGNDETGGGGSLTLVHTVTRTVGGIVKFPWLAAGMAVPSIGSTVYVLSAFNASTMPVGTPVDLVPVNTATDAVGKAIKVPSSAGESSLAVTPDGAVVYVLRQDARGIAQNVVAVGTATGTTVLLKFAATAMAVAPDGKLAYLLGDMAVMPLATADQSLGKPISTGGFVPVALAISPNGQSVYVAGTPSPGLSAGQPLVDDLFVVNATQARIVKTVALGSYPEMPNWAVAVAPDGKYVYVLGYGDRSASPGVVVTVDAATGAVSKPVHVGPGSDEIAVAPNGGVYVLEAGATPSSGHPSAGGVVPVNTVAGTTAKPIPMPAYAQLLAAPGQTAIWS